MLLRLTTLFLSILICFSFLSSYLNKNYASVENNVIPTSADVSYANAENENASSSPSYSYDGFTPVSAQKGTLWADIALFICERMGDFFSWPTY